MNTSNAQIRSGQKKAGVTTRFMLLCSVSGWSGGLICPNTSFFLSYHSNIVAEKATAQETKGYSLP